MFKTRLITAIILLPIFVAALTQLPNRLWAVFLAPWLIVAAWEWGRLAHFAAPARVVFTLVVLALVAPVVLPSGYQRGIVIAICGTGSLFWLFVAPIWLFRRWQVKHPALLGAAGVVVLVPCGAALVTLQTSPVVLLVLMGIVWIADSAAYVVGRATGKRKLAPDISPGKSWEGVAGGLTAVVIYFFIIQSVTEYSYFNLSLEIAFLLFVGTALLSIEGDLYESWIKRQAGFKDSGAIIPGHGGVLDRIDGLTSSMPLVALASVIPG